MKLHTVLLLACTNISLTHEASKAFEKYSYEQVNNGNNSDEKKVMHVPAQKTVVAVLTDPMFFMTAKYAATIDSQPTS